MKTSLRVGFAVVGMLVVGGSYYTFMVPKIGHASRAEVEAVLPPVLRASDIPDTVAQERYRRLIALIERLDREPLGASGVGASTAANERVLGQIAALIGEGPLRKPLRSPSGSFVDVTMTKDVAKLMGFAAEAAWRRGDRRACAGWVASGLRYADSVMDSGGAVIDGLVGIAVQALAVRTAYRAEIENGLDSAGRRQILALLPQGDGASPALARTVRGEFHEFLLPVILDPKGHKDSLLSEFMPFSTVFDDDDTEPPPSPPLFGTFDPVETAREAGRVSGARIADLNKPYLQQTHADEAIAEQVSRGLPQPPRSSEDTPSLEGWAGLRFRMAMNAGHNTLGRMVASSAVFSSLGTAAARLQANRNLARAVILLRMGRSSQVLDPYSGRPLRFDPKLKIVWSVNSDGKDDGGRIGLGGDALSPDLGFPYGDHSFKPSMLPKAPFQGAPPGMPPSVGTRP